MMKKEQIEKNQYFKRIKEVSDITAELIMESSEISEDILKFLSNEPQPADYLELINSNATIEYYECVKKYPTELDTIIMALNNKITATEIKNVLSKYSGYEAEYEAEKIISEMVQSQPDLEKTSSNIDTFDKNKTDEAIISTEYTVNENEKNIFTDTIENFVDIEDEEVDSNLEQMTVLLTKFITEDREKTHKINDLKRIVILAEKYSKKMEKELKNKNELEIQLKNKIKEIENERDDYKEKYLKINNKINELKELSSISSSSFID